MATASKKTQAEIAALEAETRRHHAEAQRAELETARLKREENYYNSTSGLARIYPFIGAVRTESVKDCMDVLGRWSRRDPGQPMTIVFNSPGGSVIDGLALYDFLEELKDVNGHHITTMARGMAASMGGILLQSGTTRVIGKNAFVLIHEVSSIGVGKTSEMEDELKFVKRLQERLLDILAERSTMNNRQIKQKWQRKDWWLSSKECIELGFADEIG